MESVEETSQMIRLFHLNIQNFPLSRTVKQSCTFMYAHKGMQVAFVELEIENETVKENSKKERECHRGTPGDYYHQRAK